MKPLNLCRGCGQDFGSVAAFDAHRVGKHAYLYSEEHPDGRRCLSIEEMEASEKFSVGARGRWGLTQGLEGLRRLGKPVTGSSQTPSEEVA